MFFHLHFYPLYPERVECVRDYLPPFIRNQTHIYLQFLNPHFLTPSGEDSRLSMACSTPSAWCFSPNSFSPSPNTTVASSPGRTIFFPLKHQNRLFFKLAASSDEYPGISSPKEEASDASDPVKLAFAKSEAYRKAKVAKLAPESKPGVGDAAAKEATDPVRLAMEKARDYKKNKGKRDGGGNAAGSTRGSVKAGDAPDSVVSEAQDPVRLAMEKAREYKKDKRDGVGSIVQTSTDSGLQKKMMMGDSSDSKDGVINDKDKKRGNPTLSGIDFVGLNFSDKKKERGLPAGLAQAIDPIPQGDLPEVEIIVGDASKFEDTKSTGTVSDVDADDSNLYKPMVSTWGVFPRPDNISKTFGGGRNIRPGEVLEAPEIKAAKDARSRELIASYKNRLGLNIDPRIKSKCEKALVEGDNLMELGRLWEALPYYEIVMNSVVFQSELHGLAALQWSICQDSLSRQTEARDMYEKLQAHPNVQVSKKARQFMFGFQAMEMMKITSSSSSRLTGYENYFEAFLEEKSNYKQVEDEEREDLLKQVFPYILFLLSPILILLLICARKGT